MPFICEVCGKNDFRSETGLKCHKTKVHGPAIGSLAQGGSPKGTFRCEICGKNNFMSETGLKCHKTKVHGPAIGSLPQGGSPEGTFRCEICGKNDFMSEAGLKGHKTKMHCIANGSQAQGGRNEGTLRCEVCGKNDFISETGLKGHKTKVHGPAIGSLAQGGSPEGTFRCEICGKNDFMSQTGLKCHKTKVHGPAIGSLAQGGSPEGTFRCEICGKNDFMSEAGLKGHKTKVHGPVKGSLRQGSSPEGTFRCEICGKNDFMSEAGLKGHKTKMHCIANGFQAQGGRNEGTFRCEVCGKNDFRSETGLKCHKTKVHGPAIGSLAQGGSPEGTFRCEICGKNDFMSEAGLKGHKTKMHCIANGSQAQGGSPEGTLRCEVCGKNDFMSETGLKCHKTKVHGPVKGSQGRGEGGTPEGTFRCEICGRKDFMSEASLKGHKTKMHCIANGSQAQGGRNEGTFRCEKEIVEREVIYKRNEAITENCIRVKSESPSAAGSYCEAAPPRSSHKKSGAVNHDDQQMVSPPTPHLNNPGGYLSQRMESAQLRLIDINRAAGIVRDFIEGDRRFRKTLNEYGGGFQWDILTSGSYYDKTKNMSPDEFDFMISPMNLQVDMEWNSKMPKGFCKIVLRNKDRSDLMTGPYLDPVKFKVMAFKLFGDAAKSRHVTRKKKDMDSPAYTIFYHPGAGGSEIDIDLVPSIEIKGWPKLECCRQVNPRWVTDNEFCKKCMERFHVVAKTCPDTDYPENERKLLWRMSFSAAEKHLILHANRGNDKSIRKPIFRFLKTLLEETKRDNEGQIKKLCSYHLKMFMLHQFDSWPSDTDDASHKRDSCIHILKLLNRILEQNPTKGFPRIDNYFLKGDNVIRHVPNHETELFRNTLQIELDKIK